jgi:SHAQKYF class myb-like DNA-binding protein
LYPAPCGIIPGRSRTGSWTSEEKAAFVTGLGNCGRKWKELHLHHIKTRTLSQIKSYAQKKFWQRENKVSGLQVQ